MLVPSLAPFKALLAVVPLTSTGAKGAERPTNETKQ